MYHQGENHFPSYFIINLERRSSRSIAVLISCIDAVEIFCLERRITSHPGAIRGSIDRIISRIFRLAVLRCTAFPTVLLAETATFVLDVPFDLTINTISG